MCHSGVGLTPVVDGQVRHFSAGGLYNGLILLIDDETQTYWDHITGYAVHGPDRGRQLAVFPITMTTVAQELAGHPETTLSRSRPPLRGRLFAWMNRNVLRRKGFLPPGFRGTMGDADERLPAMTPGLGVIIEGTQRFYPVATIGSGIEDTIAGTAVRLQLGELDSVPEATLADGSRPMQLFTRWYGFAYTYPACEVHARPA